MRYTPSRGTWRDTSSHNCGHMHLYEFGKKKKYDDYCLRFFFIRGFFIKSWKEGDKNSITDLQVWMLRLYVSVENEAKSHECDITTYDSLTVL